MLLREQAIDIIEKYVNQDNLIVFTYSFPMDLIPSEARDCEEWEYETSLEVNKRCYKNIIRYAINQLRSGSEVIEQTDNEIMFTLENKITFHYYIDKINKLQKEFDLKDDGNMELSEYIKYTNEIKELEYFLIDNAELILNAKVIVDKKISEENKKISDINLWRE